MSQCLRNNTVISGTKQNYFIVDIVCMCLFVCVCVCMCVWVCVCLISRGYKVSAGRVKSCVLTPYITPQRTYCRTAQALFITFPAPQLVLVVSAHNGRVPAHTTDTQHRDPRGLGLTSLHGPYVSYATAGTDVRPMTPMLQLVRFPCFGEPQLPA